MISKWKQEFVERSTEIFETAPPEKETEAQQDYLLALDFIVTHKRVRRLLKKKGIMAIYPKRNLRKLGNVK